MKKIASTPSTSTSTSRPSPTVLLAPIEYCVEVLDAHAHLFKVTLTIAQPAALQRVALPVWIPGSYLVPLKNPRSASSQAVRTALSCA